MSQDEIKKLVGTDKMVIGTNEVSRLLKGGSLAKVFIAQNTEEELARDLTRYSEMSGTELEALEVSNDELGILCKKPFSVSVVGMKK